MSILGRQVRMSVVVVALALALLTFATVGAWRYQELTAPPATQAVVVDPQPEPEADLGNLYAGVLKDPYEVCLFLFADGSLLTLTTKEEFGISMPTSKVMEVLKVVGPIKDILLVVHSHPRPSGFSLVDNAFYSTLKDAGFRGVFGIYCPIAKTVTVKTDLGWGSAGRVSVK